MKTLSLAVLTLLGSALSLPQARANELFGVDVLPAMTAPISVQASTLPDLVVDLIDSQGAFAPLLGQAWAGQLRYFGVDNAIAATSNAAGTVVNLQSPLTGLNVTFTGPSRGNVADQVEDWFLENGAAELAALERAIAKQSPATLTDGNPQSTTNMMADSAFNTFGFDNASARAALDVDEGQAPSSGAARLGFGIGLNTGRFEAELPSGEEIEGFKAQLNIPFRLRATRHFELLGSIPINYTEIEDTVIFGAGASLGLKVRLSRFSENSRLSWSVTPFGSIVARGSYDAATGGLLAQFGATHAIDYKINRFLVISMANQFSHFESIAITVADVRFDQDLSQQLVKNGLKLTAALTRRIVVEGFVADTRFLQDVAVDDFQSGGLGISFPFLFGGSLSLGGNIDYADNFTAYNIGFSSGWGF